MLKIMYDQSRQNPTLSLYVTLTQVLLPLASKNLIGPVILIDFSLQLCLEFAFFLNSGQ
jgi:hypothetical protein